jgi:hypothetical protein
MVRNTHGGSKTKSQGRKFSSNYAARGALRMSEDPLEQYACVTKIFGQGRCEVHTVNDTVLQCIIRNKFRGRSKRNNVVGLGSILLVGLREWEGPDNYKHCDVLEVYDPEDVNQLRSLPASRVMHLDRHVQSFQAKSSGAAGDLTFTDDADSTSWGKTEALAKHIEDRTEDDDDDDINIEDI